MGEARGFEERSCFDRLSTYGCSQVGWARSAHAVALGFDFPSPVRRLDSSQTSGGLGEHCSSSAVGHGVCAPPGRVAQPRLLAKYRGNPEGAANRGRPLLVTFLGKTRKVTSCRATPVGVGLEERSCFDSLSTNGCNFRVSITFIFTPPTIQHSTSSPTPPPHSPA
jgi:hypothetical protein